jgi:hypothetical protein
MSDSMGYFYLSRLNPLAFVEVSDLPESLEGNKKPQIYDWASHSVYFKPRMMKEQQ